MRCGAVLQAFVRDSIVLSEWDRTSLLAKDHFQTFIDQSKKNKRTALRSRQDSNLRGETPMDF